MGTPPNPDPLTLATPALLLLSIAAIITLTLWDRRIRSASVATHADIIRRATRSRTHARAMIAWHGLGALVIVAAFGLLSWPTALAALPLLALPALGIRKWARTTRTLSRILHAPQLSSRRQLQR